MKRNDALILSVAAFVAANCISYFVRSGSACITGWGYNRLECHYSVGFPLVMFGLSQGLVTWSWIGWGVNVLAAISASLYFARHFAARLPALWAGHVRAFRFSVRELLVVFAVVSAVLGLGMVDRSWGRAVRNLICLSGPPAIYAWHFFRRQLGWARVTVAALALILIALAMDVRYDVNDVEPDYSMKVVRALSHWMEPEPDLEIGIRIEVPDSGQQAEWNEYLDCRAARIDIAMSVTRTVMPICGLMSMLVVLHIAYDIVRRNREKADKADGRAA